MPLALTYFIRQLIRRCRFIAIADEDDEDITPLITEYDERRLTASLRR